MISKVIDVGVCKLHVAEIGEGPPLICSHSLFCDGTMFQEFAIFLASKFRIIVVDSRAHGQSEIPRGSFSIEDVAKDLLYVLDELGIEKSSFLGVSMGGMASMRAALIAPERVSSLILIDTEADTPPFKNWFERWLLTIGAPIFGVQAMAVEMMMRRMFCSSFRNRDVATIKKWRQKMAALKVDALVKSVQAVNRRPSLLGKLHEISVPTLLIYGSEDYYTPVSSGERIKSLIKGATLKVLSETGHLSVVERPEDVAKVVAEFYDSIWGS